MVWYMELTEGGCEALAHLYEKSDGRITIMVPDFEGSPKIVGLGLIYIGARQQSVNERALG